MSSAWINKVKAYNKEHPNLTYKECLIKLGSKKKKQSGGNPALLALAQNSGQMADALDSIIGNISNAVDKQQERGFQKNMMTGWYDGRKRFKNERIIEAKTIELYNRYLKLRDKGKFPNWSDDRIWEYASQNM
jgi:hypothetical protein